VRESYSACFVSSSASLQRCFPQVRCRRRGYRESLFVICAFWVYAVHTPPLPYMPSLLFLRVIYYVLQGGVCTGCFASFCLVGSLAESRFCSRCIGGKAVTLLVVLLWKCTALMPHTTVLIGSSTA